MAGRQALISMRTEARGRADQRGCLILRRGKAGRRYFSNNEVKRTIDYSAMICGEGLLSSCLPAFQPLCSLDPPDLPPSQLRAGACAKEEEKVDHLSVNQYKAVSGFRSKSNIMLQITITEARVRFDIIKVRESNTKSSHLCKSIALLINF